MVIPHPEIVTVNERAQEKFLRKKTADFDFSKFSQKEINELVARMRRIMKEADGIGLAANQIGLNMRVFVAELQSKEGSRKFYAIFNPEIEKPAEATDDMEEGCLSVPGIFGQVSRKQGLTIRGFDKNGKRIKIKTKGLLARVFQHEVDHLNGTLFIDKAKDLHEVVAKK